MRKLTTFNRTVASCTSVTLRTTVEWRDGPRRLTERDLMLKVSSKIYVKPVTESPTEFNIVFKLDYANVAVRGGCAVRGAMISKMSKLTVDKLRDVYGHARQLLERRPTLLIELIVMQIDQQLTAFIDAAVGDEL